ncbi:hypothetical protein HELRODRAFT_186187 [Helobdella robusta]|uniref:Ribosome assembly factor mrt4 n=1 Tax=Helobdella robusta TaxID=6412 RepID=T1FNS3_HELRO|nr:hypothetical protein HELRODRAFT_186187 [Helobdella robusta]ESN91846.1 hypothetical protein HELRODRAFT_186187 [Helobdella robusta]
MPKSKRNKAVSLTKTKKKGLDNKKLIVTKIHECIEKYKYLYVISVENMRSTKMKDVRQEWGHSRFLFGKNKVMALALGKTKESEHQTNLHRVTDKLRGQTGILFTDTPENDVLKWFESYVKDDYARSGNRAPHTVVLQAGPVPSFSHSIEPQLRQLGLPTSLERGVITLLKEFTVCRKDDVLNPEQARILKLFDHKMSKFRITITAMWTKKSQAFKSFEEYNKKLNEASSKESKTVNIRGEDLKPSETTEVEMQSDNDGDDEIVKNDNVLTSNDDDDDDDDDGAVEDV